MPTKDKECLKEDYEQLRAYALSPVKIPSRTLGLDLWIKKGCLSWIVTMLNRVQQTEPGYGAPVQAGNREISADLLIALANILIEWSENYIRLS